MCMYKNKHSATNKLIKFLEHIQMKFLETYTNQLTLHETFSRQKNVTMNKVFIRSQFLVTALILVNLTFVITKSAQEWPSKATERLKVRLLTIMWLGFFFKSILNCKISIVKLKKTELLQKHLVKLMAGTYNMASVPPQQRGHFDWSIVTCSKCHVNTLARQRCKQSPEFS